MAPERHVASGQVPSRRIPVLVGTLPIEDGQSPPPVVGELGRFPLIFTEAGHDGPDETVSTWRVRAEPGNDGKPRGPGRRWDGTPHDRPPFWPTTLHGDGWSANWPAPRPVTGQVELRGTLVGDLGISSRQWVRGRVTRARVVTETIDTSSPDHAQWRPIPAHQTLREVETAPRWFDHGLVAPPGAPATGWYSPVPGDPYIVETGVLVELDLDDVPPLPLRPAIIPAAVSAHGEDLWIADAALPLVIRLRGADPHQGAALPEVHRYTWPGRILTNHHTSRRVHADETGCWITGPDGVARADLDGTVDRVDEQRVTTAHASASTLLVAQLPADAPPTADALDYRLFTMGTDPVDVVLPPRRELRAVAADGTGSFVLLLQHVVEQDNAPEDGSDDERLGATRLARLDRNGQITEAATGTVAAGAQLIGGPPVLLRTQTTPPQWWHLQSIDTDPSSDLEDLEVGPALPVMLDAHHFLTSAGRVFVLGATPDAGRRPDQLASPESWWPLPGPFTHPEDGRYDMLTELDPRTAEPVGTTLLGRPDHLTVDSSGTVWLPGYASIYSCPPSPGSVAEPFDVAVLLDQQEKA